MSHAAIQPLLSGVEGTRLLRPLLLTQFLGAVNDNFLKTMIILLMTTQGAIWFDAMGTGGQGGVTLCMTIPFMVLSGYAGQIADRISKRSVSVWMKAAEIPIAVIAGVGILIGSFWVTLVAFVLICIQSTFFGPAKYGMVPELVGTEQLSHANGLLNMLTNIAVIVGTVVAGPVLLVYGAGWAWVPLVGLVAIAVLGVVAVVRLPSLEALDPGLQIQWNPLATYWQSLKVMARGVLLPVTMGWGAFYFLAMLALLNIFEYQSILGTGEMGVSILLGILGVAIGVGSVTCGLISRGRIRPRLVIVGAGGMTVAFGAMGVTSGGYLLVAAELTVAGFFAGFFVVPLQAMLQFLSPEDARGRFLGTANAVSFAFMSVAAALYWMVAPLFEQWPWRFFLLPATVAAIAFVWSMVAMPRHIEDATRTMV
jgi:acyl-[acyl-carrier-protein]-phospholipid O-acyltransferase/long-chain-fatty-acid--[acyl-carrier-protein] ligase